MSKNTTVIVVVLLIVILAIVGYFFFNYRDKIMKDTQQQEQSGQQEIKVEDKKITDKTKPLNISIVYPFIEGADDFNNKVQNLFTKDLAEFKQAALDTDTFMKENDPESYVKYPREYAFDVTYEKGVVNQTTASFLFKMYVDTGGAHGNGYYIGFAYNLKDKKEITLANVFAGESNYLKKVSDYAIKDLTRQMIERTGSAEGSWIADGAGPKEENFSAFLVKENSVVFYFAPYQVAASAVGDFQVTMPR